MYRILKLGLNSDNTGVVTHELDTTSGIGKGTLYCDEVDGILKVNIPSDIRHRMSWYITINGFTIWAVKSKGIAREHKKLFLSKMKRIYYVLMIRETDGVESLFHLRHTLILLTSTNHVSEQIISIKSISLDKLEFYDGRIEYIDRVSKSIMKKLLETTYQIFLMQQNTRNKNQFCISCCNIRTRSPTFAALYFILFRKISYNFLNEKINNLSYIETYSESKFDMKDRYRGVLMYIDIIAQCLSRDTDKIINFLKCVFNNDKYVLYPSASVSASASASASASERAPTPTLVPTPRLARVPTLVPAPLFKNASNTALTIKGSQTGRIYQKSNMIIFYKYIKESIMQQFTNDKKAYTRHLCKQGKKYCSLDDLLSYCSDYYCSTLRRQCFHRWDQIFNQLIKDGVSNFNLYLIFNKKMYCIKYHSTGKFSTVDDEETTFNSPHVIFRSVITKSQEEEITEEDDHVIEEDVDATEEDVDATEEEDDETEEDDDETEEDVVLINRNAGKRKAGKRKATNQKVIVEVDEDEDEDEDEDDDEDEEGNLNPHIRKKKKRNMYEATHATASTPGDFTHSPIRDDGIAIRDHKILVIGDLVCMKSEFKKLLRKNIINLKEFVKKCNIMYYSECKGRPDSNGYTRYLCKCYKLKLIGNIEGNPTTYKFEIDYDSAITNLQYTDLCNFTETCDTFGKICSAEIVNETDIIISF